MLSAIDHDILRFCYALATSSALAGGIAVFFAEWFPFIVFGSVVVYEFYAADEDHHIVGSLSRTIFASFLAWFLIELFKYVHPAARPFAALSDVTQLVDVSDPFGSFPSAHAGFFGALAGTMLGNRFHAWKWYLLAAILIAIGRVAVGVHWPVDVTVGLSFGFALGFLIARPLAMAKFAR